MNNINNSLNLKNLTLLYDKLTEEKISNKIIDWTDIYYDEPKIFIYNTICNKHIGIFNEKAFTYSGLGSSFFSPQLALLKSLTEASERICLLKFNPREIQFSKKKDLNSITIDLDPYNVNIEANITFGWVKATNIVDEEDGFVPAQLIYPNYYEWGSYEMNLHEPFLSVREPGGSAGGFDKQKTITRAVMELVERDAYLTMHLTRSKPLKLNIKKIKSDKLTEIIYRLKKYHLEYYIYDITNDLEIPVYMTLLIDRSAYGPAINVGLRCGLDFQESVIQSIEDALQNRFGVRAELIYNREMIDFIRGESIAGSKFRGLFWARKSTIKKLDYFLRILPVKKVKEKGYLKIPKNQLNWLIYHLKTKGFQIWVKDITLETFRKIGFYAFKAVIPGLQPLYTDEGDKIIMEKRLISVNHYFGNRNYVLNKNPHLLV